MFIFRRPIENTELQSGSVMHQLAKKKKKKKFLQVFIFSLSTTKTSEKNMQRLKTQIKSECSRLRKGSIIKNKDKHDVFTKNPR